MLNFPEPKLRPGVIRQALDAPLHTHTLPPPRKHTTEMDPSHVDPGWQQGGGDRAAACSGEHAETSGAIYLSALSHVYRVGPSEPDMNLGSLAIGFAV